MNDRHFLTAESETRASELPGVSQPYWGLPRRLGFRFLFCYIMLLGTFCVHFIIGVSWYFISGKFISSPLDLLWSVVVPWVARHIFRS